MDLTQKTTEQESGQLREDGAIKYTESEITQSLEEKERDRIEGLSWACDKANENPWDCLILTLGMIVFDAYVCKYLMVP